MDVGRPEQLLTAARAILTGAVQTAIQPIAVGKGTNIAPDAQIDSHTAIGHSCRIGAGTRLEDCLVLDNVRIGSNVSLRGVIVDDGATIEDEVVIEANDAGSRPGPVVAAGSHLARGTRLT